MKQVLVWVLLACAVLYVASLVDPSSSAPGFDQLAPGLFDGSKTTKAIENPFESSVFNLRSVFGVAFAIAFLAFWSWILMKPFLAPIPTHGIIKFFASFIIGQVLFIGLLRILTLVLPHAYVVTGSMFIAVVLLWFFWETKAIQLPKRWNPVATLLCINFLILVFFFLVHEVEFAYHPFSGHGDRYSLHLQGVLEGASGDHFPFFACQYNEFIFNYWLGLFSAKQINPLILIWISSSIAKASAVCLLYSVFSLLGLSRILALSFIGFLFLGNFSLFPFQYQLLFDAHNPLGFVLHADRVVGPSLFILALSFMLKQKIHVKIFSGKAMILLCLMGIGVTAMSAHYALMYLFFIGASLALIPRITANNGAQQLYLGLFIMSACMILAFVHQGMTRGIPLIFAVGLGIYFLTQTYSLSIQNLFKKEFLIFGVVTVVAMVTLGNVFTQKVVALFGETLPLYRADLSPQSSEWFHFSGCYEWSRYCESSIQFLINYGLILIAAITSVFYFRKTKYKHKNGDKVGQVFIWMTVLSGFIFYVNFIDHQMFAFAKTRVLEIPVYAILVLFAYAIAIQASKYLDYLISAFLCIWIVIPLLLNHRFEQWFINLSFLWSQLG